MQISIVSQLTRKKKKNDNIHSTIRAVTVISIIDCRDQIDILDIAKLKIQIKFSKDYNI